MADSRNFSCKTPHSMRRARGPQRYLTALQKHLQTLKLGLGSARLSGFPLPSGLCYNRKAVNNAWMQPATQPDRQGDLAMSPEPEVALDATPSAAGLEDASRYCPVCSQRLESRRCKLVCGTCGYYMSCADYY